MKKLFVAVLVAAFAAAGCGDTSNKPAPKVQLVAAPGSTAFVALLQR